MLTLLTEALRAGPGSPAWHEALQRLRAGGVEHADEYRLLVAVREHLESGKAYRSVRAGPEFTQRLMESIEAEALRGPRLPSTTTVIALLCAAVMLVVLAVVGYLLWTAADHPPADGQGTMLLVNTVGAADFSGALPQDWRTIGRLSVELTRGAMKYTAGADSSGASGGGVLWNQPIPPEEPFVVAANFRVHRQEENLIAQVFVTDDPQFSDENSTTPHELVWLIQSRQAQLIVPSGRVEAQVELARDFRGGLSVQVTVDREKASVDLDGKQMWSGPSGLDPHKPRYAGVRFLRRSNDAGDGIVIQSVAINMRPK